MHNQTKLLQWERWRVCHHTLHFVIRNSRRFGMLPDSDAAHRGSSSSSSSAHDASRSEEIQLPQGEPQRCWWQVDGQDGQGAGGPVAVTQPASASQELKTDSGASPSATRGSSWLHVSTQAAQLAVVLTLLLLLPASTQTGGLQQPRVWLLAGMYAAFFGAGAVLRIAQFGPLRDRAQDRQRTSIGGRMRLLAFIATTVLLHWLCMLRAASLHHSPASTWYDFLAVTVLSVALWMHMVATAQLGKAWDRVVVPDELITTGLYAWVQHPIYTSYMLLFLGLALACQSAPLGIAFLVTCLWHYSHRTALEAEVLGAAFGDRYVAYTKRTPFKFVPGIL